MSVGQQARFRLANEVHARDFDGDLVILSLQQGDYFGTNEVGARLWRGLVSGKCVAEVADEISADYEVTREQLVSDLLALADELVGRGLLTLESSP